MSNRYNSGGGGGGGDKIISHQPEQLNPSPSVNGSLHVHVKFGLSNPSLVQSAFVSHGSGRQGSGTVK